MEAGNFRRGSGRSQRGSPPLRRRVLAKLSSTVAAVGTEEERRNRWVDEAARRVGAPLGFETTIFCAIALYSAGIPGTGVLRLYTCSTTVACALPFRSLPNPRLCSRARLSIFVRTMNVTKSLPSPERLRTVLYTRRLRDYRYRRMVYTRLFCYQGGGTKSRYMKTQGALARVEYRKVLRAGFGR